MLQILESLLGMATAKAILGELIKDELKDSLKDRLDFFIKKITGNTSVGQYYKNAVQKIYREKDSDLVGEDALSHNDIYMDAYSTKFPNKKILSIIQDWSHEAPSGVMLIHGEPGHGKTTLCRKAVCEHTFKKFCPDKTNVFWFRLNPAFAEDIIENGKFVLKNAFCWGNPAGKFGEIPLEENEKEYQNSVIFLDGYDELKAQLHGVNKNLQDFITVAKQIAQDYDMHIVITTRTRSLSDEGRLNIPSLQFAPISEDEQDAWIEKNARDYKEDFEVLRESSEEMKEMLGIPILFRMVVKAKLKSTIAKNVVDLYDTLFEATMERRAADDAEMSYWRGKYEQFAYEIYCNDEQFADVEDEQRADEFLYMFYIKGGDKQHVEFLHRSFYQYFLAHFLYRKMSEVKGEKSAEAFLCCLAERKIDFDVLNYIQQIQKSKQQVTQDKCEQIINTLEQTGTIIGQALKAPNENGDAEKHPLLRCEKVLTNALSICCIVASAAKSEFTVSLRNEKSMHQSIQRFNCISIWLENVDLSGADLSGADLLDADLNGADLSEVNLSRADLRLANLRLANLRLVNLSRVDLSGANLNGTDLRWAKNLNECHCELVADWSGCKILLRDRDKLGLDDPDAHGIIWCNDDGTPIEP
ncbi:MAG: pentapeptide repeat-containing protein [Firmicutes bacterium]|nr:pentapeptide repeat-containing protein [Bacillota bacterium]